jgi:2'-5' RNA ligase
MSESHTERLFFALWPDNNVRRAINQLSQPITQNITGKVVVPDNWHITLAFLGDLNVSAKECMQKVVERSVQGNRFSLSLDKLGYWPNNRILWLGASEMPDALQTLVSNLTTQLQRCDYRPELRPFQVHLTLMRKAAPTETLPPITPVVWAVEDFCLVRSILSSGKARYEVITRWALD